ncbi:serine/threonine-protein kinase/endoribonuclease IRE1-like [Lampris incognitus]|uniref:serine/threonine-protein kinase/endoribonuclease IRE1-like n=1 Tax=Lampris incognitus TaxID=2546036 RepID=UPI0024B5B2E4|nr:serine/threonine-protein kinase/endoribonuclease IRE1-like [Lampris incognitus]
MDDWNDTYDGCDPNDDYLGDEMAGLDDYADTSPDLNDYDRYEDYDDNGMYDFEGDADDFEEMYSPGSDSYEQLHGNVGSFLTSSNLKFDVSKGILDPKSAQLSSNVRSPPRKWHKISERWQPQLERLANIEESRVVRVGSLIYSKDEEFRIANGSDGSEVFLGLREDGTEVAIKRTSKINYQLLKNEEEFLRCPELDNNSIVRYFDMAEDENFGYLALQLCEYTLEEYVEMEFPKDTFTLLKKDLVNQILTSLQVLHSQTPHILHRDLKPQNVLIDVNKKARLADFGISRRLPKGRTTLLTRRAGTKCWMAKETLNEDDTIPYKRSTDIQVAGMLIYYIFSGGHHPFGKGFECEYNIYNGKYKLEHVRDVVAVDLVESMINEDPKKRPTVDQCLAHPFFWLDERKVEYLRRVGNLEEVENCRKTDPGLIRSLDQSAEGGLFNCWKNKFPPELVKKLDSYKRSYPENSMGLLRFIRNLQEHHFEDAASIDLMTLFPDLFIWVYKFAKQQGWHSRPVLIKMF